MEIHFGKKYDWKYLWHLLKIQNNESRLISGFIDLCFKGTAPYLFFERSLLVGVGQSQLLFTSFLFFHVYHLQLVMVFSMESFQQRYFNHKSSVPADFLFNFWRFFPYYWRFRNSSISRWWPVTSFQRNLKLREKSFRLVTSDAKRSRDILRDEDQTSRQDH